MTEDGMETCYAAPYQGRSGTTQETWGAAAPLKAHVQRRRVRGEVESSTFMVITNTALARNDLFWLPGVDQNQVKLAVRVKSVDEVPVGVSAGSAPKTDHYEATVSP